MTTNGVPAASARRERHHEHNVHDRHVEPVGRQQAEDSRRHLSRTHQAHDPLELLGLRRPRPGNRLADRERMEARPHALVQRTVNLVGQHVEFVAAIHQRAAQHLEGLTVASTVERHHGNTHRFPPGSGYHSRTTLPFACIARSAIAGARAPRGLSGGRRNRAHPSGNEGASSHCRAGRVLHPLPGAADQGHARTRARYHAANFFPRDAHHDRFGAFSQVTVGRGAPPTMLTEP